MNKKNAMRKVRKKNSYIGAQRKKINLKKNHGIEEPFVIFVDQCE